MEVKTYSSEEIYEILKNRIIQLDYEPGQILNEKDVAEEFNVSRTPIRKVFEQLKNNKLLNIIPRYGAQVAPIDFMYMKSVFEVIRELDGFAASLAAKKIDTEKIGELETIIEQIKNYDMEKEYTEIIIQDQYFHEIIFESAANPCLVDILDGLHMHAKRMWIYAKPEISDISLFLSTMPNIVKALKSGNSEQARKYAKNHTDIFVEQIKQEFF